MTISSESFWLLRDELAHQRRPWLLSPAGVELPSGLRLANDVARLYRLTSTFPGDAVPLAHPRVRVHHATGPWFTGQGLAGWGWLVELLEGKP